MTFLKENWQKIMQIIIFFVVFCLIIFFVEREYISIGALAFFLMLSIYVLFEKSKGCNKLRKENDNLRKFRYERKN